MPATIGGVPRRELARVLIVFALLAGAALADPATLLLTAPVVPLPVGLLALRYGARPLWPLALGLAGAALFALAPAGWTGAASTLAFLLGAGIAIPLVLGLCRIGGPLGTGGTLSVAAAIFATGLAALAPVLITDGWNGVRAPAVAQTARWYESPLEMCAGKDPVLDEASCEQLEQQRATVQTAVADHTASTTIGVLALSALLVSSTLVWLLRSCGSRWGYPVQPAQRFVHFHPHWAAAYVLAAGLAAIMAGVRLGSVDEPLALAGLAAAVGAGCALLGHGAAVFAWIIQRARLRWWLRTTFWLLALLATVLTVGVFIMLALLDTATGLRAKAEARDAGSG